VAQIALIWAIKGRSKQSKVNNFSVERAFLCSFRNQIRDLHDLLSEKPSLYQDGTKSLLLP
jgi:hypothetical protein